MNDDNFDKYLKISNLSVIITKIGYKIDFIDKIYSSIGSCIRESNIDFLLDQQKDYYFIDEKFFREKYSLDYKVIGSDIIKIKKFNQSSKSKIIIIGYKTLQKLYYASDFILEYIDSKPKIIKNRYYPIYD